MYGEAQNNALYSVKNKASVDPFTAVPTYSQRFARQERSLPDWCGRVVCRELFPEELLGTIEPEDGPRKKRRLELSTVSSLPNAEEAFGMINGGEDGEDVKGKTILEKLDSIQVDEVEEGAELEEEEGYEEEEQDEVYDDEDAGDYDAENYFDNGDELGEDYGEGEEGEGTF